MKARCTSSRKSSTLSLDFPLKVVTFGCGIERENDISGSVGFEDGERSSGDIDESIGVSWEAGGSGGSWEALVSVSRAGEEISLRFLLL